MAEQQLDTLFYEIEARTQKFDQQIDKARAKVREITTTATPPVKIEADTKKAEDAVERVTKKTRTLPGVGTAPAVVKLSGDVTALEHKLEGIKDAATALGMTSAGKPLVAKLDADIAAFTAKVARARAVAESLENKPITAKITAQTTAIDASLKKTTNEVLALGAQIDQALGIEDVTDAAADGVRSISDEVNALAENFGASGGKVKDVAAKVSAALSAPALAAAALTAAVVSIGVAATKVAAENDRAFRSIAAALPTETGGLGQLNDDIIALSTSTPRTVAELSALAKQLADLGESDPAQIASDLKLIALSADALGKADASELVDLLDAIADSFQLTGKQSRDALTQILSLSKGKISIDDLSGAFGRGATSIARFTSDAVGAARALTVLIDANIQSRKLIPGVLGILEQSEQALVKADQAAAASQDGSAKAYRDFAGAVNKSAIETKGLLPVLADLYKSLGGTAQNFAAAGLTGDQFTIAMRAAEAVSSGAAEKTETLRESMDKLQASAAINNGSAQALAQLLKNDLSAALAALGSTFLPPVIDLMNALANRFNDARRNALAFSATIPKAVADLQRLAQLEQGPLVRDGQLTDRGRQSRQAVTNALPGANAIIKSPTAADGLSADELAKQINAFAQLRDIAKETNAALGQPINSASVKSFSDAIAILTTKLQDAAGADANSNLAAAAARNAAGADRLSDAYRNQAASERAATKAAQEAADRFADATRASDQYTAGLGRAANPLQDLKDRQVNLAIELDRMIAKLPKAEQAAARLAKGTILDQLAEGTERVRAVKSEEITQNIAALLATISGEPIAELSAQYDGLIDRLTKVAEAADVLDTAESRASARSAREAIPAVKAERDALIALEKQRKALLEATKKLDTFQQQSNANFRGSAVTIAERNASLETLTAVEQALSKQLADGIPSLKARKAVEEELLKVRQQLKELDESGSGVAPKELADSAAALGKGIAEAAQSGLALVQVLGQGNTKIGSMLAGVLSLGKGIESISTLAQKAGGFKALFSTGAGVASALPGLGTIAGGLVAISQAVDLFGSKAKERERQLRERAREFNDALDDFLIVQRTSLEQSLANQIKQAEALRQQAVAASGIKINPDADVRIKSTDDIRKQIEELNGLSQLTGIPVGVRESILKYRDALQGILKTAEENEALLRAQNAAEISRLTDNLEVRRLSVAGLTDEASAERDRLDQLETERQLREKYGDAVEDYIRQLREVTAAEQAAAAAARERANALSELDDQLAILGGTPLEQLSHTFSSLTKLFPELAGLADGLDLSTREGLDAFQERLRDLFRDLDADGIQESERPIVEAIKRLLGGIGAAVGELPDALDPFTAALEAFGIRVEVFGLSAAEQLEGLAAIFAGKFEGLDEILSGADLTTGAGRDALKSQLQTAIAAILEDGVVTDEERPFLEALQRFFGLITGVIDDATADAENAAAEAAATRRKAIDSGNAEIAVRDLEGTDAFKVMLESLGPAFSDLFGVFDLSTVDGVESAKAALWELLKGVDDGTISLEQFAGMTRDEVIAAILGLDGALDTLQDTATRAADAARELAEQQESFTDSVDSDFLRASGQDREADIAALKADIAAKVARAKELGLSESVIARIIETGRLKLIALNQQYDDAAQRDAQSAADAAARANPENRRSEFIASAVTQISSGEALRITDYLASSLIEHRATRAGVDQLVALMGAMVAGNLPALSVPALPPGVSIPPGGQFAGAGGVVIQVIVNGPISGMSPEDAGRQVGEAIAPYVDAYLARSAGIQAKVNGRQLS